MTFEPGDEGRLGREGVDRRERLLGQLRPVVARRGRRRRVVAGALVGVIALIAGVVTARVLGSGGPSTGRAVAVNNSHEGITAAVPGPRVRTERAPEPSLEIVTTSKGIAERVGLTTSRAAAASDEDLIAALRATGQDPGLVRVDGRVIVAGNLIREGRP